MDDQADEFSRLSIYCVSATTYSRFYKVILDSAMKCKCRMFLIAAAKDRWRLPLVIGGMPVIPIDFSEPLPMIAMRALSVLGTIPLVALAALALALVFFWRRQRTSLIVLGLTVGGGELIGLLIKWLFVQPRPRWPDPLVVLTSASFPSGHAMRSLLFYGLLSYFIVLRMGSWRGRVGILLVGGGLVLLIGVSRVYLEAHSLSEVLAGYAFGFGWLLCLILGIITIQRKRQSFKTWGKLNLR